MKTSILMIHLFIIGNAIAQDAINFIDLNEHDYKNILKLSKEKEKLVFIYFTTRGCPPCIKMHKEVFPDVELVQFLNDKFICVKTQYAKDNKEGLLLRDKYDIIGYPNFVVINNNGDIIHRLPRAALGGGYKTKNELIQFGREALGNEHNYAAYIEKYDNGDLSFDVVSAYLELLTPVAMEVVEGRYDNQAQRVLDRYFATQAKDGYSSKNNWYLIKNFVDNASTEPFQHLLKHYKDFYKKYGKGTVDKRIFQVLNWYGFYGSGKRTKNTQKEMENWKFPHVKAKLTLEAIQENPNKDLNAYAKELNKIYTNYHQVFRGDINNSAWKIYKASKGNDAAILAETLTIAEKWMELLTEEYPRNIHYQDTYAKIQERLGNME